MTWANHRSGVVVFLLFTFGLSSIFYFLIIKSGHVGGGGGSYAAGLMWCPGVAALLTCKYLGRGIDSLGWRWGKARYQAACYLIPLGYAIVTYGFVWLTKFALGRAAPHDARRVGLRLCGARWSAMHCWP